MSTSHLFTPRIRQREGLRETHTHVDPFTPSVQRAASPSDSIDTAYGADTTSAEDAECSPDAFEGRIMAALRLHEPREDEVLATTGPVLLPKPKSAVEEKLLFEQVMRSLRWHVQRLQEEVCVEDMAVAFMSRTHDEPAPSAAGDVHAIMASVMGSPGTSEDRQQ
ncbi:hypothetical protein DENSPDRAFT_805993 [Dentipellis sp. KUC8613]|nr:hypothetical protein DENSPDRAFT_805993 [Dentipellis sp. KUC8613]